MPFQLHRARVSRIRNLTHDVRDIDLELLDPKEIAFKPGQFVSFEVTHPASKLPATRPYSIASPPSRRQTVTLLLNLVPGGPGSGYLFSLKEGDHTQFKGPAGAFYLKEQGARDLLFVATGTGIAPFLSMIPHLFDTGFARPITLFWGLRSQRDLYLQEELAAWSREHPNFAAVTTLSRPEPGWAGPSGRVTKLVEERLASVATLSVYLCGNSGMLADVTASLNKKGLCPIHKEKWYDDAGEAASY